jgi:hypothetical protein
VQAVEAVVARWEATGRVDLKAVTDDLLVQRRFRSSGDGEAGGHRVHGR